VGGLGEAAHGVLVLDRTLDADVVGDFLDRKRPAGTVQLW
jgi:hypothetical protein